MSIFSKSSDIYSIAKKATKYIDNNKDEKASKLLFEIIDRGNLDINQMEVIIPVLTHLLVKDNNNRNILRTLAVFYYTIGQNYLQKYDYSNAHQKLSKSYELASKLYSLNENDSTSKEHLGVISLTLGDLLGNMDQGEKSVEFLEQAKELNGIKYDVLQSLGQQYYINEDFEKGEDYLRQFASQNQIDYEDILEKTKLLLYHKHLTQVNLLAGTRGHTKKEFEYISKAIHLIPSKQNAYEYLGICYDDNGENKSAMEAYLKGLEVDPMGEFTNSIKERINKLKSKL